MFKFIELHRVFMSKLERRIDSAEPMPGTNDTRFLRKSGRCLKRTYSTCRATVKTRYRYRRQLTRLRCCQHRSSCRLCLPTNSSAGEYVWTMTSSSAPDVFSSSSVTLFLFVAGILHRRLILLIFTYEESISAANSNGRNFLYNLKGLDASSLLVKY